MRLMFEEQAWDDYQYWESQDKRTLKALKALLSDVIRNGYSGIGKPEPLRGNLSGLWSRRIDDKNRLVYKIDGDVAIIYQCRGHYADK